VFFASLASDFMTGGAIQVEGDFSATAIPFRK
jgi:hypothetical protein